MLNYDAYFAAVHKHAYLGVLGVNLTKNMPRKLQRRKIYTKVKYFNLLLNEDAGQYPMEAVLLSMQHCILN